jgi:hypothetical protein
MLLGGGGWIVWRVVIAAREIGRIHNAVGVDIAKVGNRLPTRSFTLDNDAVQGRTPTV